MTVAIDSAPQPRTEIDRILDLAEGYADGCFNKNQNSRQAIGKGSGGNRNDRHNKEDGSIDIQPFDLRFGIKGHPSFCKQGFLTEIMRQ